MNNKWIAPHNILPIETIGNFRCYFDESSGTLEWWDKENDITIYATPNWNADGEVTFDVNSDNELGYHNVCTIKMVEGDISTQLTHYLNVLIMVMNHYSRPKS